MLARRIATTYTARLASAVALLLPGRAAAALVMLPLGLSLLAGCSAEALVILPLGPGLAGDESGESGESGDPQHSDGDDGQDSLGSDGESLDLPDDDGEPLFADACIVRDGLDAAPPCDAAPPSHVFDPVVAWTWTGPNGEHSVLVTPLVANLDDDNGDDSVDLCDRPDLLVVAVDTPTSKDEPLPPGHIYLLDTASGATKQVFAYGIDATATPALADLDDDGVPEILAFEQGEDHERRVIALRADGSLAWASEVWVSSLGGGALSVADLDGDGSPEILAPEHVLAADGSLLWLPPESPAADSLPIAADLDLDGDLEVVFGRSIYDHYGNLLFQLALPGNQNAGIAAVANFDDDPYPEIYVHSNQHRIFEHDGTPKAECLGTDKSGPATIVDTNGDGQAELLANHGGWFRASAIVEDDGEFSCETLWSVKVIEGAGTAFDFLADGSAEAIYADLDWVRIFDQSGAPIAEFERSARPSMANPIVVDADNDGAAELIIVGSEPEGGDPEVGMGASVLFVQNSDDRFAPTRRIWNQHAYHATNVREDGRVPVEQQSWLDGPNSFRSNPAPDYAGEQCQDPQFP